MTLLIIPCLWIARHWPERVGRDGRLAFVVANLCALVGSLWSDVVGEFIWGPPRYSDSDLPWDDCQAMRDAYRATAFTISENVYTILWGVLLAIAIAYSAFRANRGDVQHRADLCCDPRLHAAVRKFWG